MGEFGTVPRRGLFCVAIVAVLTVSTDLFYWTNGSKFSDLHYAILGILIFPWFVAIYAVAMSMIERSLSVFGLFRFTAINIVTMAPILTCLAVLIYAARNGSQDGLTSLIVIVLLLIGLLFVAFLPAWPIAQAVSTRFVNPMRIVKATKGYRWSLILVFFTTSSVNKFAPSISSASNVGEAIGLASIDAIVTAATTLLTASIEVTAWKFASKRDASLVPFVSVDL